MLLIGINILLLYWLFKSERNNKFIKPILIIILVYAIRIYVPFMIGLISLIFFR